MPGNMDIAIQLAQAICWDEGYGYRHGGHAASHSDGCDCGGLVFHCMHAAGYNVSDTSPGTSNMPSILRGLGFTEIPYSSSYVPQNGDIVVMNHSNTGLPGDYNHGHTFFIAENINAYVNGNLGWRNCNSTVGNVALAKVEASGIHDHPEAGDQDNGHGAHTEVWCHTYPYLFYEFHDDDPNTYDGYYPSEVTIYRDPSYTPGGGDNDIAMVLAFMGGGGRARWKKLLGI